MLRQASPSRSPSRSARDRDHSRAARGNAPPTRTIARVRRSRRSGWASSAGLRGGGAGVGQCELRRRGERTELQLVVDYDVAQTAEQLAGLGQGPLVGLAQGP